MNVKKKQLGLMLGLGWILACAYKCTCTCNMACNMACNCACAYDGHNPWHTVYDLEGFTSLNLLKECVSKIVACIVKNIDTVFFGIFSYKQRIGYVEWGKKSV